MRIAVLIIFAAILSGCANNQSSALKGEFLRTVPQCHEARDCELKWSAARNWVLRNAGFKIQTYNDDFIETYNPLPNSPALAARVIKEPIPSGGYEIRVELWCNNIFGCVPDSWASAVDFNKKVSAAGAQAASAEPLAPASNQLTSVPTGEMSRAQWQQQQLDELAKKSIPYEQYQQEYRRIMGQ
ncbi:hypothetical protein JVX91_03110 [Pseudomonas sp. PDNC002]|uniref:hypothetical protein n=1 Tax=Pseudomonas sp. PDNC002 TaxID=2811422 RepID=UPI001962F8EC|nr:hypothetical protein [Pseudomonas sp. PDNC002]QRY80126.1 hypothetical protein JVX91_03110 [Pseudomonas sp. PDNC002]